MNSPAQIPPQDALPAHTPSPVELEVGRIRELSKLHRHAEALAAAEALGARFPENRDVLHLMALNLRFLQRIPEALVVLERLQQVQPGYSRLYQERGQCHVALRDAPKAIEAFLQAVNINPALPTSWSMLERLYRMTGDARNAATASDHIATLKRLPPEVIQAGSFFSDGEILPAENIIRAFLLKHGDHVEGMRLLARIGHRREILDDAELLLAGVLRLAPDYRAARTDYARVLIDRHKYVEARGELDTLLKEDSGNPDLLMLYATASTGLGDNERAIDIYRQLLPGAVPEVAADLHLWLAHALKTTGKQPEAIEEYRAAAAARPGFGDAYWSLANLKTWRFPDDQITRLREQETAPGIGPVDHWHLCFALGRALEDQKDYAASWQYYERGNALKRAASRYRSEIIETNTRLQKQLCTAEFFAARAGWGSPDPDPIFILGLPRSGSTLIEQILASHRQVEGTQELAEVGRYANELRGRDLDHPLYPGALANLSADEVRKLGDRYLADTRIYRRLGRPFFIDKMPNNFRHIGLIHLMLPNARIIDARREPMACCFGNFKQLFATGQEFTYAISDIARYYRTYLELMRHWDEALPGRVLKVQHEDVVEDLEGSVRRILDHCGLPFEPACLEFHKTERSVRTASSEQVRRPISREGLTQWKNYEPWLGPLRDALGDALTTYKD